MSEFLSDTDRDIIDALVEHCVATAAHLSALLEIPERTVRYRLSGLRSKGYVRAVRPPAEKGSAPDHWCPTRKADSWAKGERVPEGGNKAAPSTTFVEHSAAITALYVALRAAAGLQVVEWVRDQLGSETIAQLLNSEGLATKAGVPFSARTVIHMLSNPIYVGKVIFKDSSYPGLHESLVEEETFAAAQRILRERGESQALKRGHPADYLLSGVVRCGYWGRAFIGTAATGRSRCYHYYTCSTRYRYGTRTCGADRLPKGELEEAVLDQMIEIYRDSGLIAEALAQLQASERDERESAASRVATLRQEQAGVRRSMDRYFAAFEAGTMQPSTCQDRLDGLQARLDALIAEEQALLIEEEAEVSPTPELVAEWAQTLNVALYSGTAQQRKALIRKLVKELRVMSRDEIIPDLSSSGAGSRTRKSSGPEGS